MAVRSAIRRTRTAALTWAGLVLVTMVLRSPGQGDIIRPMPTDSWLLTGAVAVAIIIAGWIALFFVDATIQAVRRGELGRPPSLLRLLALTVAMVFWLVVAVFFGLIISILWSYDCGPTAVDCAGSAMRRRTELAIEGVTIGTFALIVGWAVARVLAAAGVKRSEDRPRVAP